MHHNLIFYLKLFKREEGRSRLSWLRKQGGDGHARKATDFKAWKLDAISTKGKRGQRILFETN
jgi:hypothetical protein